MADTGHQYRHLFDIYVPIGLAVFALIALSVGFALVRYRRREEREPSGRHDAPLLEGAWVLVLACTAATLLYFTFKTEARVDRLPKRPDLVVDVTSAQWNWTFAYPRYRRSVISTTQRPGTLVVPSGTPVLFRLRSSDVIHSFWIPRTRFKKDVFPGTVEEAGMVFPHPGNLGRGECAEFCGLHHADMSFRVQVMSPGDFDRWARGGGP